MSRHDHDSSLQPQPHPAPAEPMQPAATPCNKTKIAETAGSHNHSPHRDLSQKQLTAIDLLLQGHSDAQAADALNLDRTTVYRWRTLHAPFRYELQRQRRQLFQHTADRLRALLPTALDALQRVLTDDKADPRLTLRAATTLLRLTSPTRQHLARTHLRSHTEEINDLLEATLATNTTPDERESDGESE